MVMKVSDKYTKMRILMIKVITESTVLTRRNDKLTEPSLGLLYRHFKFAEHPSRPSREKKVKPLNSSVPRYYCRLSAQLTLSF